MKKGVWIGAFVFCIFVGIVLIIQLGPSKEKVSSQFAQYLFNYPLPSDATIIAKHQFNGKPLIDSPGNGGYWNVVAIMELSSKLTKSEIYDYYHNAPLFPYPKSEKRGAELEIYFEDDIQKVEKKNGFYYRSQDGGMNLISNYTLDATSSKEEGIGETKYVLQLTGDFDYFLNFD